MKSRAFCPRLVLGVLSLLLIVALTALGALGALAAQPEPLAGWLDIVWGDPQTPDLPTQTLVTLTTADGQTIPLDAGAPGSFGELLNLRGQYVVASGEFVNAAAPGEGFRAVNIQAAEGPAPASAAVTGSQPWVSILCKFNDVAAEPKTPGYFQDMYGGAYPRLDHYWREQSYDLMNVVGSDATNVWYTLPQPRSYYVYNMDADPELEFDFTRATTDCTGVANAEIYYPSFVGINMMFNADLDGYAWGGSRYMTLDGVSKTWYTTWEPPWGYDDICVIEHEMGHGFGLPHSSGEYGATYDNQWDVMSDTWSNCGRSTDATFGCLGQHTISYHKNREGWVGGKRTIVPLYSQATVTLEQIALPQTANQLMVEVPINGSITRFYTVEARRNAGTGYDVKLPASAVIIHNVDTGRQRPANVKDIDNNGNTGDAGAQWLPGETYTDATNNITIRVDSATATGFVVIVCNACNQPTPTPTTPPSPTPTPASIPMHVGDLDNLSTLSGNKWTAKVEITVHNAAHQPVSGAVVSGAWSSGTNGSGSCTTASTGKCTVSKGNLSSRTTSVRFTVSKVTRSGYTYQSSANHDPDGDSNGTVITVRKP